MTPLEEKKLAEYRRRQRIHDSLEAWAVHALPDGQTPAAHHRLLIKALEEVTAGQCNRLAFILPPGSAKSTYASVLFPPWFLAKKPGSIILSFSHGADLAADFGRKCRNLVNRESLVLGYDVSDNLRAADHWMTTNECEYFSLGVGGRPSGRRADLAIIDDPVGSKEDAESPASRKTTWNWYEFDLLPRLKPGAPIILIQTRWHEDDLAGHIFAMEEKEWKVIHIPFVAMENDVLGRQPGETLWPEWYEKNELAKKAVEKAKESKAFSSLYQGQPSPEEGDLFKWEWIEPALYYKVDQLPKNLRNYVASDHALTKKRESDRSCLIPYGIDENEDIWIYPDVWWKKADTGELVEAMVDMAQRRKPVEWFAEDEQIFKGIGPFLNKRMMERKTYFVITGLVSSRDLVQRSGSIRGRCQQYKVHFPCFANSWWHEAKHEMLMFPNGTHDDFVAALAKIGQGLESVTKPASIQVEKNEIDELMKEINRPQLTLQWMKDSARRMNELAHPKARYGDR